MNRGLFVYGTLHPDRAPAEIRDVVRRLVAVSSATVLGKLHDVGEYPALVTNGCRQPVAGTLFALPDDPDVLRRLDAYEEFDPKQPKASLSVAVSVPSRFRTAARSGTRCTSTIAPCRPPGRRRPAKSHFGTDHFAPRGTSDLTPGSRRSILVSLPLLGIRAGFGCRASLAR